ncbi:GNAT family N-acetyltransferase [Phaeacidiphilus oryzae]|uniref:GNAT family N-acetyltransferase n=1 Tax=Phaeacidiphilus oryzae TaxID=348818 RepID=UPI000B2B4A25|nr:GNAT family N-acetyltransferase [Phaeacidiphilus oryzae]
MSSADEPHPSTAAVPAVPAVPAVTIRSATAADAADLARIHLDSRAATMPYLPPQRRTAEEVAAWFGSVVLRTCRVWVAVRAAESSRRLDTVGYAAVDGDLLEHLYLRPDVRRQGIGTLLLDAAKRHSPHGLSLHVFQQNTEARAFYTRHGFRTLDTSDGARNMEHLPDMTLRWDGGATPPTAERRA